jgi:hypothetical protein
LKQGRAIDLTLSAPRAYWYHSIGGLMELLAESSWFNRK